MKDNSLIDELTVTANELIDYKNKEILNVMEKQHEKNKPFDLTALMMVSNDDLLAMGGRDNLKNVFSKFLTLSNFHFLQESIKEFSAVETAREKAKRFLSETENNNEPDKLEDLNTTLSDINLKNAEEIVSFSNRVSARAIDHSNSIANGLSGANTGFLNLNRVTDGYKAQKLYIIGARPSVGKTAFSLSSMYDGVRQDDIFPTYVSLETSDGDLIDRMIAKIGRINLLKIKNVNKYLANSPDEYQRYTEAMTLLSNYELDINEKANTVAKIRAIVRRNKKAHPNKKHVVFIDYLTLIKPAKNLNNDIKEIGEITNGLKEIAKDFNVAVVTLAQLTRGVESRQDKRPVMSDLRGGGEIEQIADLIGFLYREDYQNQETENKNQIELIIQKHRDGPTGTLKYKFMKEIQNFIEIDERFN
jgi:replicative DNA helicase